MSVICQVIIIRQPLYLSHTFIVTFYPHYGVNVGRRNFTDDRNETPRLLHYSRSLIHTVLEAEHEHRLSGPSKLIFFLLNHQLQHAKKYPEQ